MYSKIRQSYTLIHSLTPWGPFKFRASIRFKNMAVSFGFLLSTRAICLYSFPVRELRSSEHEPASARREVAYPTPCHGSNFSISHGVFDMHGERIKKQFDNGQVCSVSRHLPAPVGDALFPVLLDLFKAFRSFATRIWLFFTTVSLAAGPVECVAGPRIEF